MLRVMKERVGSHASSESSSRHSGEVGANNSSASKVPTDTPQVISIVPNSISVPTITIPSSSNSSVSSDGAHRHSPHTRISEDERTFHVDSPTESSRRVKEMAVPMQEEASRKRSNDQAFARNVSVTDLEATERSNEDVSTASKRRKLTLDSVPTHVLPSIRLLAMPEDSTALNSLHTFCRMQIEVFTATPMDMAQPAPGRKTPIKLHQVGLRCIHCRHLSGRGRVKRAVCYPKSVSRIYHSVSDMKFDHFPKCEGFSPELRAKFQALKEECSNTKRRTSSSEQGSAPPTASTAQYYHDAACKMGLVNSKGSNGIFMAGQVLDQSQLPPSLMMNVAVCPKPLEKPPTLPRSVIAYDEGLVKQPLLSQGFSAAKTGVSALCQNVQENCSNGSFLLGSAPSVMQSTNTSAFTAPTSEVSTTSTTVAPVSLSSTDDMILLAMPEDSTALNDLHCFVRRNVEVFVATKEDAAAPSPGRKTRVKVGQVGLRCIHCARLPIKQRVKRAVCYPPSVSGIYHSVSNMKFDHFGKCQGLSEEARVEFTKLKTASGRRNTTSGVGSRGSSSTSQYYHESATRLGLIDTQGGIQFRDQVNTLTAPPSRSPTDGISALMIAATNPTVRAEYDARQRAASMSESLAATSARAVASV